MICAFCSLAYAFPFTSQAIEDHVKALFGLAMVTLGAVQYTANLESLIPEYSFRLRNGPV